MSLTRLKTEERTKLFIKQKWLVLFKFGKRRIFSKRRKKKQPISAHPVPTLPESSLTHDADDVDDRLRHVPVLIADVTDKRGVPAVADRS